MVVGCCVYGLLLRPSLGRQNECIWYIAVYYAAAFMSSVLALCTALFVAYFDTVTLVDGLHIAY